MSETTAESADRGPKPAKTPTVRGFIPQSPFQSRGLWRRRVAAADLPDATADLVRDTVERTKLSPREKLAVADELIAHFHDADRQGADPGETRADFGDPAVTARLIRRSKKRNRGWLSKLKTWVWWGVGAFAVAYALLAVRFYTGEPEVKVDYLAKLNAAALAVPEEERAWPEIGERLAKLGFTANAEQSPATWLRPGEEGWEPQLAFMRAHEETIESIRQLAARPTLGPVGGESPGAEPINLMQSDLFLNAVGPLRRSARLLAGASLAAAVDGDRDRTHANLVGIYDLARLAGQRPTVLDAMTAISIAFLGHSYVHTVLEGHPDLLSKADLLDLQKRIRTGPRLDHRALEGERAFFGDQLQRTYTDDGAGGGRLAPAGLFDLGGLQPAPPDAPELQRLQKLFAPLALLLDPGRRAQDELHAAAIAALGRDLERPLWDEREPALAALLSVQAERGILQMARHAMPLLAAEALTGASSTAKRSDAAASAALLALALHRLRLAEGEFPDPSTGDAALVPAYLDAIPLDPLHGTPMRWTLRDGRPVIYSLGADGDDDGGVPPADALGGNDAAFAPPEDAVDGDWIAWPPGS